LAIYERVVGREMPATAWSLRNLAMLLSDQGDLAAARPMLERALGILERGFGPGDPNTVIVRENLAALIMRGG